MSKRWLLPAGAPDGSLELAAALGLSPVVAAVLCARGAADPAAARRFLSPSLDDLHDPFLLPDMRPAVERVAAAVRGGERVMVHGDYDVDGVCAAALLTRVLRVLKADVRPFVPHRREDGYDLRPATVHRAAAEGVRLILTADCGSVAFEAAEAARSLGIDLVITDHHEPHPSGELPFAAAVVNAHRPDSAYPFPELCGTAVAYKLAGALLQHLGVPSQKFQTAFLDLVALATCADCMPLLGENRVLVTHGLETLRRTQKAGLKALMDVAGLSPDRVNARSLGFALGPRINAIGRLDAASHALDLLLTADTAEAGALAARLDEANRERQQEQERILQDALRQAERYVDDRILVLESDRWHAGIIGIVASKLTEALCRPTVMVALDAESGTGRGSCRSVEGFHIFNALNACREHLERCGGHQAAAGFEIRAESVPALRDALRAVAARELDEALLTPCVRVDAELPVEELSLRVARELARLEPFGHGNPEPVFVTRGLEVTESLRLANRASASVDHLKLRLRCPTERRPVDGLFWRAWARAAECPAGGRIDACHALEINRWNGGEYLQLNLKDLRTA